MHRGECWAVSRVQVEQGRGREVWGKGGNFRESDPKEEVFG